MLSFVWWSLLLTLPVFGMGYCLGKKRQPGEQQTEITYPQALAHDIRTPLSLISSASELLLEEDKTGTLNDNQHRFVKTIHTNAKHVTAMAEAFLAESKLDNGYLPHFESVDLRAITREIAQELREINTIPIYLSDPGTPLIIQADKGLLRQVIWNLINNAARHSHSSEQIEVRTYSTEIGAVLKITDYGDGIPEEAIKTIYDPFCAVTPNEIRSAPPGTGLGMGIVKRAVTLHEGKVAIDSITSKGTSIHVTFPWERKG